MLHRCKYKWTLANRALASVLYLFISTGQLTGQDLITILRQDKSSGVITSEQELVYRALAVVNPEALPNRYRELKQKAGKSGTFTMLEVKRNWNLLSAEYRRLLQPYMTRPYSELLPDTLISPSGRFKIHYTTQGALGTTESFAQKATLAFDLAYEVEIEEMGYPAPPPDNGIDGPEHDVYITNIGDYGYTYPEEEVPSTPRNDWTTYTVVDNDYPEQQYYTPGVDGLRVTAAHEYFHSIHYGIREPIWSPNCISDVFYYEVSATWMEDVIWDDVNDYYFYLPYFFDYPYLAFNSASTVGLRMYGLSVWNHFIAKKFGPETIRNTWEYMKDNNGLEAIRLALDEQGVAFEEALSEFSVWNYFTGELADTVNFYEEGRHYPLVRLEQTINFLQEAEATDSTQRLASRYYKFTPQLSDAYAVDLDVEDNASWRFVTIVTTLDGDASISTHSPWAPARLGQVETTSEIVVVPSHVHTTEETDYYPEPMHEFSIRVYPDSENAHRELRNDILKIVPNPFIAGSNLAATILLESAEEQDVTISILGMGGRVVSSQSLGVIPKGSGYPWQWNGTNDAGEYVSSGVYVVLAEFGDSFAKRKVAVIRQ